jgi:hypothetical protein
VLNSETVPDGATATSSNAEVPVDIMVKHYDDQVYIFAVAMRDSGSTTATFTVPGISPTATVEVIGESRTISASGSQFQDTFAPLGVHLYRVDLLTTPQITSWQSVADHGSAGSLVRTVTDNAVEARDAGLQHLRIRFDIPLDPATVDDGSVTIAALTNPDPLPAHTVSLDPAGTVMTVLLASGLPDINRYTITVEDTVLGTGGLPVAGDRELTIAALAGDVDGNGTVTPADLLAARAAAGDTSTAMLSQFDVSTSGAISGDDLLAIRGRLGNALP